MIILSPSILASDYVNLGEAVRTIGEAGAQYVHIDVMDGAFVPNISIGAPVVKAIRPHTDKVFDVHLMVEEPGRYIKDFVDAGADLITVHAEACKHLHRTIQAIKEYGVKVGVALNPATPLSELDYLLGEIDMVLIMTVNPGYGGQKYIDFCTQKIKDLKAKIDAAGVNVDIQVDGGITLDNAAEVIEAGANILVAGSAVYKGNAAENVKAFLELFKPYEA